MEDYWSVEAENQQTWKPVMWYKINFLVEWTENSKAFLFWEYVWVL